MRQLLNWFRARQDSATGIEGEIADLAVGYFGLLDGYVVQAEYLNSYDGPVIPYGSTPYFPGGGFAAVPGPGRGQPGTDGNLSTSLSSPIPASRSSVLSTAMDLPQTVAPDISHRAGADSHTDDFFAALAVREKEGTEPLQRLASRHGKEGTDLADQLASDLAA